MHLQHCTFTFKWYFTFVLHDEITQVHFAMHIATLAVLKLMPIVSLAVKLLPLSELPIVLTKKPIRCLNSAAWSADTSCDICMVR